MPQYYNPALFYTGLEGIVRANEVGRAMGQPGLTPSQLDFYARRAIEDMYHPYVTSIRERERLEEEKRQFDIKTEMEKDIAKEQAQASKLSALTSLAGTAGLGYLLYKSMPKAVEPVATTIGTTGAGTAGATLSSALAGTNVIADVYGTIPAATTGAATGTAGTIAGAIPGWGWAGLGAGAITAFTTGDIGRGAVAGASSAAGALIGSAVGGPVGGIIGGAIGGLVGGGGGGTVICTELYRQGIISSSLYTTVHKITDTLPLSVKLGYYSWAIPLVKLMRKSKIITKLVSPLAIITMHHISSTIDTSYHPNIIGKVIWKVGKKLCDIKGKSLLSRLCEVCHA